MHNDVLEEFQGSAFSRDGIQPDAWDKLLDSDLGNPASEQDRPCRTLKSVLEERIVQPFAQSIDNPSYGAAYSAVLFGPPGTAKTSICEALAQRMGYDFVVIDTAAFLADGLTNVAARIQRVVSISGVHDLHPLLLHSMNQRLGLNSDSAVEESPALCLPISNIELVAWVGALERPEFLRQSALLTEAWGRKGLRTRLVADPARHHFDVVDGLKDENHPLTLAFAGN